jgi:acyl-CoA thioester hydrolase
VTPLTTDILKIGDCYDFDIPMRWADADSQKHLNNAVYFRYFEEARMQLLYCDGKVFSEKFGAVLVSTQCEFLKPVVYPAQLKIRHSIVRLGRSSMEAEVELYVCNDLAAGPYAKGRWIMVSTYSETGKSVPWSEARLEFMARAINPYRPR